MTDMKRHKIDCKSPFSIESLQKSVFEAQKNLLDKGLPLVHGDKDGNVVFDTSLPGLTSETEATKPSGPDTGKS